MVDMVLVLRPGYRSARMPAMRGGARGIGPRQTELQEQKRSYGPGTPPNLHLRTVTVIRASG